MSPDSEPFHDNPRRRPTADLISVVTLAVLGLGIGIVPMLGGGLFFFWDNARLHFPRAAALHDGLRAGYIPQWSFSEGSGYPIVGEGNAGHYHPIHLLVSWLLPAHIGFMCEMGLYIALIGVMTYACARTLGLGSLAGLMGGLTGMLGSFSIVSIKNIAHPRSLWLLPLVVLLAEQFVTGRHRARALLLAGVAFGLQLVSGNPQFAVVTAVASGLYVGIRVWHRSWSLNLPLRSAVWQISKTTTLWATSVLVGAALAAVQLVPQVLHAGQSTRVGGMSFQFAMMLPASLRYMGQLLLPFAYEQGHVLDQTIWAGDFNETSYRGIYMGVSAFVLCVVALWHHRRWPWPGWTLFGLAAAGLTLGLADQTPVYPALWTLPVFGSLRFTFRFLAITGFGVAVLAAIGMSHLTDADSRTNSGRSHLAQGLATAGVPLVTVLVLAILLAAYLATSPPPWLVLAHDFRTGVALSFGLITVAVALVFGIAATRGGLRTTLCIALLTFTVADLMWFRARSDYAPTMPVDRVMTPPPVAAFLLSDPDRGRVLSIEKWESVSVRTDVVFEFLQSHANSLWKIDSADPYESLMLGRYFVVREGLVWELFHRPATADRFRSYLGALNIKYVIAPRSVTLNGWEKAFETERGTTWRNPLVLPRAFLVGAVMPERLENREDRAAHARVRQGRYADMVRYWEMRAAESQIIDDILESSIDFSTTAIVDGANLPRLNGKDPLGRVSLPSTAGDTLRVSVTTDRPGFLVIANNHYPGWTATVGGTSVPLYRANWVMSGVFVPAGSSEVVLQFSTPGLGLGFWITLLSLMLVAMSLWALRGRSTASP